MPTLAAVIRNVKLEDTATIPTKDHQPAWSVGGKRNDATEMGCVARVPVAIMCICIPVTESILTPHIPALDGTRHRDRNHGHYSSHDLGWQNLGRPHSKMTHIKAT
ncbi:Dickkopf-related protein 2 [Apodemus speciosus]|uniref:Dickkopf-related protein 2 n=1 Tax=Apodemus speciosus TaxID=105296 RepID=A0ABQ0EMP6_APOSI